MKQFEVIIIEKDSGKMAGMYPANVGRVPFSTYHEALAYLMHHRMQQHRIQAHYDTPRQYAYIVRNGY